MFYIRGRGACYGPIATKEAADKWLEGSPANGFGYGPGEEGWSIEEGECTEYLHVPEQIWRSAEELAFMAKEFPNGYQMLVADVGTGNHLAFFMEEWGAVDHKEVYMLAGTVDDNWEFKEGSYEQIRIPGPKAAYFYPSSDEDCSALYVERGRVAEFKACYKDFWEKVQRYVKELLDAEPFTD